MQLSGPVQWTFQPRVRSIGCFAIWIRSYPAFIFSILWANHGGIETCTATVSIEIGRLQRQRQWPGLKVIGKVERTRETAEKTTTETAYYLLSRALAPERFNEAVRQHWGIEHSLYWRLDVVMYEDQDRTRAGNGAHNPAVLRHMVINAMQKRDAKAPCAESSNAPDEMTGSYADSWRCFEMRLPCPPLSPVLLKPASANQGQICRRHAQTSPLPIPPLLRLSGMEYRCQTQ